jgi:hypothetical protein
MDDSEKVRRRVLEAMNVSLDGAYLVLVRCVRKAHDDGGQIRLPLFDPVARSRHERFVRHGG